MDHRQLFHALARPESDLCGDLQSAYYRFLHLLAAELPAETMVELGTWHGAGAYALATGCPVGRVWAVDIDLSQIWKEAMVPNISFVQGESLLPDAEQLGIGKVDLLFVDTEHNGLRPQAEYEAWRPRMAAGGVVLFDDIRLNGSMSAWWDGFDPGDVAAKIELPLHGDAGFGAVILK